jgi:acyl-homoserine-lactone acylase
MKDSLFLVILIFLLSCSGKKPGYENEILWDTWGIPHIYADTDSSLYKMMGWAQMRNHGNLLLKLYGEARAKSAEYWETDPEKDILLHQTGVLDAADKVYTRMADTDKRVLASFVAGINAYAARYPEQLDARYRKVLPVRPLDVVYHTFRVMYLEFLIARNLRPAREWSAGSNAWAINGSKTASGNAMLLANPHLPWNDFWLFFEAQLIKEGNSLYGTTLVGLPTLGIAFNENLGWTHTVNTLDNVDYFEISIKGDSYLLDGNYQPMDIDSATVWTGSERLLVQKKRTAFGTIIEERGDKALAISWPNRDGVLDPISQWRAMGEADNLEEFQAALDRNALPLFNVLYSDREDNILYQFGGHVPKKNGDWGKWQELQTTSSSKELWDGLYPAAALPRYTNPSSGWIQNANDPPYTSTFPAAIRPSDYASHIAPNSMGFRPQRSAKLIMEASNLSLDEFIALKHDTKSELALRLMDDFEQLKTATRDSLTLAALQVLTDWDGSFDAGSTGAVLFHRLIGKLGVSGYFAEPWSPEKPLKSPDGLKDRRIVLEAISQVARDLVRQLGRLDPAFGDHFRLKAGAQEFPGNGGPNRLGLFRTVEYAAGEDGRYYSNAGETFVCAIEFGSTVTAKAILGYGNATQPNNPHVGDQLALMASKQLREVWYTREAQESNLERIEKESEM